MTKKLNLSKFKVIPGFSKYMISEDGVVYSLVSKKIIAQSKNWAGYLTVTITDDNGFRSPRKVHRLVYLTYIGPLDPNLVVDHKDDDKNHNHYTNLQQITNSENSTKSFITGKNKEKVVWTKEMIHQICKMMQDFIPESEIFSKFDVDYDKNRYQCNMLIGQLRRGQIHKDVTQYYNLRLYCGGINKKDHKLEIHEVQNIYMNLLLGERPMDLSREYNVGFSTICKIRDKQTWKLITDKIDNDYFIIE